jgi:uncharacterized membrane protein YozB (DUF420 family)
MISIKDLPTINALLNLTSAILLFVGRIQIKKGRADRHKKIMISALISSALFLTSYLIYHGAVGSVPYERFDWTRPLYFAILIPHIILAALMAPFILMAVFYALRQKFDHHRRLVRWVWPVWMFVSVSGIVVYGMLYHL